MVFMGQMGLLKPIFWDRAQNFVLYVNYVFKNKSVCMLTTG